MSKMGRNRNDESSRYVDTSKQICRKCNQDVAGTRDIARCKWCRGWYHGWCMGEGEADMAFLCLITKTSWTCSSCLEDRNQVKEGLVGRTVNPQSGHDVTPSNYSHSLSRAPKNYDKIKLVLAIDEHDLLRSSHL